MRITDSTTSGVRSGTRRRFGMPALLTSTSMPPRSSSTCAANASMPSRSARSTVQLRDVGWRARGRARAPRRAGRPGGRRCRRSRPASANPSASAAPMPDDPPVTSTFLPFERVTHRSRQPGAVPDVGVSLRVPSPALCRSRRHRPRPLGPRLVLARPAGSRSSPAPRPASARRSRWRSRRFGADVAICDRDERTPRRDRGRDRGRGAPGGRRRARRARRRDAVDAFVDVVRDASSAGSTCS